VFCKEYTNSNIFTRYIYTYVIKTVNSVNKNKKYEDEDIIDINLNSCFDKDD
jgi:hypothetical protein